MNLAHFGALEARCVIGGGPTHHWPYMPGPPGQPVWTHRGLTDLGDSLKLRDLNSSASVILSGNGAQAAQVGGRMMLLVGRDAWSF